LEYLDFVDPSLHLGTKSSHGQTSFKEMGQEFLYFFGYGKNSDKAQTGRVPKEYKEITPQI
jgi:hypothetical protein